MTGACLLCDGREHGAHQHFCRVCGGLVDEDRIRFALSGAIVCGLCKVLVDGPDEEDDSPQIRVRDALVRGFIHRTLDSAGFSKVLRKALGRREK